MVRVFVSSLLGLSLLAVACGGDVVDEQSAAGSCRVDGDCATGVCVSGRCENALGDAGDGDSIGSEAGTSSDAAVIRLPGRLADICFDPITPCGPLSPLVLAASSAAWEVTDVRVLRGGGGFAVGIAQTGTEVGVEYRNWRAVAVDKEGGCARPLSDEMPTLHSQCSVAQAAAGEGTLAASVRCSTSIRAFGWWDAAVFHNGDPVLGLDTRESLYDRADGLEYRVAVTPDGRMLAVTGPERPLNSSFSYVTQLFEQWVTNSDVAPQTRPSDETLDGAAVLSDGKIALLLGNTGDAAPAGARIELQASDFTTLASWQVPTDVTGARLSAGQNRIAVAGTRSVSGAERAWVAVLDGDTLQVLWEDTPQDTTALPFELAFSQSGTVAMGVFDDSGLQVLAYDANGGRSAWVGPSYPSAAEPDLGIAPDGDLMITADALVAYCAVPD